MRRRNIFHFSPFNLSKNAPIYTDLAQKMKPFKLALYRSEIEIIIIIIFTFGTPRSDQKVHIFSCSEFPSDFNDITALLPHH